MKIDRISVLDIRFPTAKRLDGSDAMNPDPDYSAAYVILSTDGDLEGHGLTFTIGRGNDIVCAAIEALKPAVLGRDLSEFTRDMGATYRRLTGDSQLRWLGPEKGVMQLATAAMLNAIWDLWAKAEGKPLWRLLADMTPEETVRCIDFRYITDALTPDEALELLRKQEAGKAERIERLLAEGYPAYTTSAGWLGYSDDKIRRLVREALAQGFKAFKIKVGADRAADLARAALVRGEIGDDLTFMVDANQVWDVGQAIEWSTALLPFKPLWVEEPTSPDDILGHAAIDRVLRRYGTRVATGEHVHNRVMFKQYLQAAAMGFCQIDAARVGGVNENLAIILMAAKFGVPVCPHAGGVGLCEYVQHLSMWDFVAVSGSKDRRFIEYVDHLHEHFVDPVRIVDGCYAAPTAPGYSIAMKPASLQAHRFPDGSAWREEQEAQP
ncbi:L-fuconate dehydratase [Inquilinus limosus]|uniref:L-fuconate dehydratase n=1 Tax=Inquilinus limosus MP06 TaxID=1398085 RepID=A0A0A0DBY8_9PROT|nr:L-fuconate dehydratase [Inquilinus limosus]KGM35634.1 fuconate dehydratase [Inquilinus limosus MP06]